MQVFSGLEKYSLETTKKWIASIKLTAAKDQEAQKLEFDLKQLTRRHEEVSAIKKEMAKIGSKQPAARGPQSAQLEIAMQQSIRNQKSHLIYFSRSPATPAND
ncbi:hypothetical protein J1614_007849 [Plenodomus biglobosus]|nr:hypothetical protein J1614_007849 [Plenodomus biglobosus]